MRRLRRESRLQDTGIFLCLNSEAQTHLLLKIGSGDIIKIGPSDITMPLYIRIEPHITQVSIRLCPE